MSSKSSDITRRLLADDNAPASSVAARALPVPGEPERSREGSARTRTPLVVSEEKTVISRSSPSSAPAPLPAKPSLEAGKQLVGEMLGHFQLEEFIGGGGMGSVYRAIDTSLGRTVAVKVVSREHTDDDTLRRFRNEAQSAARLDHPNIARVYFVGEDKGWSYIVFEYIEGVNVRDLVEHKGPLPLEEAIGYTLDIAQALDHATQRDVVHRDIKPSNILVTSDGRAKLVDMGLARLHQVEAPSNDLTATGVTLGTFDYISPEQARDPRSADVRSDLYSLGCTLYFMLTGLPPFPEGTVLQKLLSHSSDPPPDPRTHRPDLPEEVMLVLSKLLAKQPGQRYQAAGELVHALLLLSQHLGLATVNRAGPVVISQPPPHPLWSAISLPWLVPLVLFAGMLGILLALNPDSPEIDRQATRPRLLNPPPEVSATENTEPAPAAGPARSRPEVEPPVSALPDRRTSTADDNSPAAEPGKTPASPPSAPDKPADAAPAVTDEKGAATAKPVPPESAPATAAPASAAAATADGAGPPRSETASPMGAASPKPRTMGTNSANAPLRNIRRVVVDPRGGSAEEDSVIVSTLAAACREAANGAEVETIELRFQESLEEPLVLTAKRPLTIRAAPGFNPRVRFHADLLASTPRQQMIQVVGGDVTCVGVNFELHFPSGSSEGWSLFHLHRVQHLRLSRCTLTIENPGALHDALFFSIEAKDVAAMMMPNQNMVLPPPVKLELDRCIARGQATVIGCDEGLPFWFTWQQGFLATTERLLRIPGAADSKLSDPIRVELANVLARMDAGLCRVQLHEGAPHLIDLNLDLHSTVILHDPSVPLIEYEGVESMERAQSRFGIRGEDNFYPQTAVLWRVQPRSQGATDIRWTDRKDAPWYQERLASQNIDWVKPPAGSSDVHLLTPDDYQLSEIIAELAGFDPAELPDLPADDARSE